MSYKILEQNGIDNENVDGGAFNNFAAGGRDGIVGGVLSECALAAAGSTVSISPGLIMLHGIRVKVTGIETLSLSSVPIKPMSYQVVAQVTLASNGDVDFSIFIRTPQPLVQDPLYQNNVGVYQAELASFTHNPDGTISNLTKTLDIIYGSGGGSVNIEVGTVTTETLDAGLDADFDVNIRNEEGTNKILLDFDAKIPRGASGTDDQAVHFTPQGLSNSQKSQARENIGAASVAEMNAGDDKSYYNLGAYDTYVDNGDGTVTVTRKTGRYNVPINDFVLDANYCFQQNITLPNTDKYFVVDPSGQESSNHAISNVYPLGYWGIDDTFYISQDNFLRVFDNSYSKDATGLAQFKASLEAAGGMYILYETDTSYPEKLPANVPLNTLDANMSDIVRDEVEKTLNLLNQTESPRVFEFQIDLGTVHLKPNTTYYLKGYGWTVNNSCIRVTTTDLNVNTNIEQYYSPAYDFSISNGGSFTTSSTLTEGAYGLVLRGTFTVGSVVVGTVMLNEGSHAYPYVPYSGQIVHQGDPDMEFATSEWEKALNLADTIVSTKSYNQGQAGIDAVSIIKVKAGQTYRISYRFQKTFGSVGNGGIILLDSDTIGIPNSYNEAFVIGFQINEETDGEISITHVATKDYIQVVIGSTGTQTQTIVISNLMVSSGSNIYPYQPYNGAIVHEKQLDDALEDYLPLTGGTINGTINATGQVQEDGERVYSPNNPPPGVAPRYMHHVLLRALDVHGTSQRVSISADFSISFERVNTDYYILLDLETGSNSAFKSMTDVYNALRGIRQIGIISVDSSFSAGQGPCEIAFSSPASGRVSAFFSEGMQEPSLVFRVVNTSPVAFALLNDDVEAINN